MNRKISELGIGYIFKLAIGVVILFNVFCFSGYTPYSSDDTQSEYIEYPSETTEVLPFYSYSCLSIHYQSHIPLRSLRPNLQDYQNSAVTLIKKQHQLILSFDISFRKIGMMHLHQGSFDDSSPSILV